MQARNDNHAVVLVIDDDELFCDVVVDHLSSGGLQVHKAGTGTDGLRFCSTHRVDVVLLDQNLPDLLGHTLCPSILGYNERCKIVFVTAHPSFEVAVKALRAGAHDSLSKPVELEELTMVVRQALHTVELEKAAQVARYASRKESAKTVLVGDSPAFAETQRLVELGASTDAPVLLSGETGTGKGIAARAIHYGSARGTNSFVSINCAALPEQMIEAELFGYEKGAFTGADSRRRGLFQVADGGTLFLDEIGEMPMHLQSKLLSALEDRKIRRLGSESDAPVDARIIAATSKDLEGHLNETFRRDLYFRLSVLRVHLPPLRHRLTDIPALCAHLLSDLALGREVRLAEDELERLVDYDWPGNVRELRNILERATILQPGSVIKPSQLLNVEGVTPSGRSSDVPPPRADLPAIDTLAELERKHINRALARHGGNKTRAAKALGIALSTLKRKLKAYGTG